MAVYITGDTHGDFRQIGDFCFSMGTKRDDVMIVLGDAGLNYFGDVRDTARKTGVSRTRMTYLMIHGNHEMRPETLNGYRLIPWNGGMVYQEEPFPNLLFAKDWSIPGMKCSTGSYLRGQVWDSTASTFQPALSNCCSTYSLVSSEGCSSGNQRYPIRSRYSLSTL